jgi:hypothetical protein
VLFCSSLVVSKTRFVDGINMRLTDIQEEAQTTAAEVGTHFY